MAPPPDLPGEEEPGEELEGKGSGSGIAGRPAPPGAAGGGRRIPGGGEASPRHGRRGREGGGGGGRRSACCCCGWRTCCGGLSLGEGDLTDDDWREGECEEVEDGGDEFLISLACSSVPSSSLVPSSASSSSDLTLAVRITGVVEWEEEEAESGDDSGGACVPSPPPSLWRIYSDGHIRDKDPTFYTYGSVRGGAHTTVLL